MGVLLLMESVFLFAQHGGRARDLLRSGHSGPKTIADLMAAIVPRPCAVCTTPPVDPTLFWFSRLSLVCLPHLMVPSGWGARGLMAKVSFPSIVSPR